MSTRALRHLVFTALVAAIIAAVPSHGAAQRSDARLAVIVIFDEGTDLAPYARDYRADERRNADPEGWGYVRRDVAGAVQALETRGRFRADHVYSHAIRGFAARLSPHQIAELENDPSVAFIEADGEMSVVAQTIPWGVNRIGADVSSALAGNGSGAVSNVNAYVIDTGIATHADLNLVRHVNFAGGKNTDCHGHGTHVAGTIGARDDAGYVVGVAPGVNLTGVKVLGCNGSGKTSSVIKGIDWVTANFVGPAVANMSLGGAASTALDDAVRRSAAAGVFYAVAAGNNGANACSYSPARAGAGTTNGIMTVAAVDNAEREASFSNYGTCVDVWAPGVSILSTSSTGGTATMSGTSMASPHGAGAGALYLSANTSVSPSMVETAVKGAAVAPGTVSKDGRPIRRLYVGAF
ncbi:MAG TPA: S8 family peptidase [Vicinamibacterales bacterium]|nr:S8 family peptidase [Vicinamibacterales bacterium]